MVPLAIELTFDASSDRRLRGVWSTLATLVGSPASGELGTAPHVTLALFREREPAADLEQALDALARRVAPFTLELAEVERFQSAEGVVFLQPQPSADLGRAHHILHDLLGDDRQAVDAYYRPGAWRPHCTLALGVADDATADVMAACASSGALGPVPVTHVQLVRYRPATAIAQRLLAGRKITVRRAREADLEGICEAHVRAIRETCAQAYTPAEIDAWAGRLYPGIHREAMASHEFFVAVAGERVAGFGQMDASTGEVVGCYVHPAMQRRGVAAQLLAQLETRAADLGLRELHLDASLNAVAFYRCAGFVGEGETRHTLGSGLAIACVVMRKTLAR